VSLCSWPFLPLNLTLHQRRHTGMAPEAALISIFALAWSPVASRLSSDPGGRALAPISTSGHECEGGSVPALQGAFVSGARMIRGLGSPAGQRRLPGCGSPRVSITTAAPNGASKGFKPEVVLGLRPAGAWLRRTACLKDATRHLHRSSCSCHLWRSAWDLCISWPCTTA